MAWKTRATLGGCACTRRTQRWSTWQPWGMLLGQTARAASIVPATVAHLGTGALCRSDKAGAVDLCLDPQNPRILYATIWEVQRTPWSLSSGGPDSSLYKSTDGGDTWSELSRQPDYGGCSGKIGVAVSPARSERVWAIVEAEDGGLFRSDNGGATWERLNEDRRLRLRPWYFCHIIADPQDAETVYVLNVQAWKSVDGGRTFSELTTPMVTITICGSIRTIRRMIEGNDGGACVSFNGGESWSTIYNQPTAQFYHVATDSQFPYRVYGTQQDNSAISVPSRSYKGAILWHDCYPVGSSESGYIAVHPQSKYRLLRRHRQWPWGR